MCVCVCVCVCVRVSVCVCLGGGGMGLGVGEVQHDGFMCSCLQTPIFAHTGTAKYSYTRHCWPIIGIRVAQYRE